MSPQTAFSDIQQQLGDRYTIERELGRGGMGAVYLARDVRLDRPVALKVLPAEFVGDSALRERFLRETRMAASFSHPNIVPVHAVEDRDGVLAFAMGFVEGESVAERVRRSGPLDVRSIVRLMQDIGYALAYAHGRGVVHRDIKPDNIMLERATGRALLMDFGISRSIVAAVDARGASQGLTRVGEVVGTPEYMSPEQAAGDVVDGRSDLYSLGLVALFALSGRPAITGDSTQQILVKQLTEVLPPATSLRADLPELLGAAIDRCLAKEPAARFQTAEALVEAIDDAQLVAPEVPVPIRLFAQEVSTLGIVLVFMTLMSWFMLRSFSARAGTTWIAIPAIFLAAIVFTRVLQTFAAARRLAVLGFRTEEVITGLRATLEEREQLRQQIRANPDSQRRRRYVLILAAALLPIAVLLIKLSLNLHRSLGTRAEIVTTPSEEPTRATLGSVAMAATGFGLLGMSFLLFARSPFRATLGERLFRLVWLGPVGRAVISVSGRGVERQTGGTTVYAATTPRRTKPQAAATPQPGPGPGSSDRVASLEARIAALERWRDAN